MAEKTEFVYHSIKLYKSESLGSGSYGGVCKAKCDGLLCAAKIMHPTLFDLRDPGADSYLRKFQEECYLLSLARHPNVVQYLATYYDPDTRLPVLLMELCDESLTRFLEHSPETLPYYLQINICHDIALALVYLHSNSVIHRDLTGNNVLMIAGTRAKITDFGMSKLATVNPRMTALTLCPGNVLYMSPEAFDCAHYTAKLDVFSFGVIVIQILTRQFPNPTDRFRIVHVPQFDEEVRVLVPETERREAHLKLIQNTHSLKALAFHCLIKKEQQRPSALELSEVLSELKQSSQYRDSMQHSQTSCVIQRLQQQLRDQQALIEVQSREAREHKARITELQSMLDEKDSQLQDNQRRVASMELVKVRESQQKNEQLRDSKQLVSEFQQSLQIKDETISDSLQTIPERKIPPQVTASGSLPQRKQQVIGSHRTFVADIRKMTWRDGRSAPQGICRGGVVVHGNTAYFTPHGSCKVYSYQNIQGKELWTQMPENSNWNFGLVVIDGLLTSVGGSREGCTNTLLSLMGEGKTKQWSEAFPPMPTPRKSAACLTTDEALVVAGGDDLDTVELMNINTKQWTTVPSLPQKCSQLSGIAYGDTLYLAGGNIGHEASKSVFTCSIHDLITAPNTHTPTRQQTRPQRQDVWKEICSLPVSHSTLASFSGELLAVSGRDDSGNPTDHIYRYDSRSDSWNVISRMKKKRSLCSAVSLPKDHFIVVGGFTRAYSHATISVEILE